MADRADANASYPGLRARIDDGPIVLHQYLIIFICFLLNVADGFDLMAMAMAAPAVSEDWQIEPTTLGVIFSSALAGMTIGAMFLAPLSDKIGRRSIIIGCMAVVCASVFATAFAQSVEQLVVIRFLTGIGIGGVLATSTSMASEFAPTHRRSLAVIIVQSGYTVGAIIVGPIASHVIDGAGWEYLFLLGGTATAILLVLSILFLPESIEHIAAKSGHDSHRLEKMNAILRRIGRAPLSALPERADVVAPETGSIRSLLGAAFRLKTLRLWAIFFLALWTSYFLVNWIPKLFVNAGFERNQGIFALTIYSVGALAGALSLGVISTRFKLIDTIAILFTISGALLALYVVARPENAIVLYIFWACISFTLSGGYAGLFAVAADAYPAEIRTTGVGWCIGVGRSGAVVSPIIAGYLVARGWDMYSLFLVLALPAILLAAFLIGSLRSK